MKVPAGTLKTLRKRLNNEFDLGETPGVAQEFHFGYARGMADVLDTLHAEPDTSTKLDRFAREATPLIIFLLGFLFGKVIQ